MNIVFINGGWQDIYSLTASSALVLISSHAPQEIDMVEELQGNSEVFKELAKYSKINDLSICFLFKAKVYNKKYISVAVFDKGKILGVSDMTHRLSPQLYLDRGQSYRVYDSSNGMFGLIVADDIYFPEVARLLRLAKAKYLVYLSPLILDNTTRLAIKANSLFNGINTFYNCGDECGIVGLYGNTIRKSADFFAEFEQDIQTDDHLLLAMRTEIYNDVFINDN